MPNLGTQNLLTTAHLYFLITIDKLVLKCKANVSIFTENHNFIEKIFQKLHLKQDPKGLKYYSPKQPYQHWILKACISKLDS